MKTRGVWSLNFFLRQKDQGDTWVWKSSIFLAKQTGRENKQGLGGSWQMLPSAWNQRTHLKILSAQVRTWQVAGTLKVAWTCSICPTLWLLMFPRLSPAARQLRWCLDIPWGCCPLFPGHWCLEAIRRFVLSGGHFSLLSLVVQNRFCSSFFFNLAQWWKRPTGARLAGEASRC